METAIMVALALHSLMLLAKADNFLSVMFFKAPALYSALLLTVMVMERV